MGKEFLIILLLLLLGIGYIIALLLEIEKKEELDLLARFLIVVFWPFLAIWYIIFGNNILEKEERKKT